MILLLKGTSQQTILRISCFTIVKSFIESFLFQMLNEQDKLVEEIFSHEDKDKVSIL